LRQKAARANYTGLSKASPEIRGHKEPDVTDIFREVEEDVRRERFQKFWNSYGAYVIVLLVLVFAGIGGWQLWQRYDQQEREKAASQMMAAQRITNPRDAANAFQDLVNAPKGYGKLARLGEANAMFAAGQREDAIALYKQIAKDDSGPIGTVARLRAAWGLADTASRSQLRELLAPLDQPGNAWRQNAEEVLAYADYRALDLKSALAKFTALSLDPESPDQLRGRAKAMAAFLKNGGPVSYGTVPPDVMAAPPAGAAAPAGVTTPAGVATPAPAAPKK
jgi:hypothetical protein